MSVINTNVASLNAQRNLQSSSASLATSLQRLSSGLRINSAKDDAAGLAIATRFTTQIRGLDQAARNANDGISLAQTAEGAMGEIGNNLQRIRELAVQSRNATNSATDRAALNAEAQQLKQEVDRVARDTSFNGVNLLNGSFTNQTFQVGANQGQTIQVDSIVNASSNALGAWISKGTTQAAVAGSYTTQQLSSLDFSQAATPATAGRATFSLTSLTGDYTTNTAQIRLTDGANVATDITLNGNYATETDVANAITAGLGGRYTASVTGSNITLTSSTSTGTGSSVAVALNDDLDGNTTGSPGSLTGYSATAGSNYVAPSALQFNVGSAQVSINSDFTGNQAGLVSAIQSQVGTDYVVAAAGNAGFSITSANAGASSSVSLTNVSPSRVTGLSGGTSVAGADETSVAGVAMTGFASLNLSTVDGADNAIKAMDAALESINTARGNMGAVQNRFSSVVASLTTTSENLSAARSRIQDADYAKETAQLTRNQILQQAGQAMLSQANQAPQGVLGLLR